MLGGFPQWNLTYEDIYGPQLSVREFSVIQLDRISVLADVYPVRSLEFALSPDLVIISFLSGVVPSFSLFSQIRHLTPSLGLRCFLSTKKVGTYASSTRPKLWECPQ